MAGQTNVKTQQTTQPQGPGAPGAPPEAAPFCFVLCLRPAMCSKSPMAVDCAPYLSRGHKEMYRSV
eukprot:6983475-Heterocapsa_arctica.AAC.1